ncbi:FCS-Like Zinc finger 15-like [Miscanthus floridulus]|uniref:FCS-Like Zinc finger 15-like n=1 Tax=Miscanthus floridulus TaxID=154761 RepID=UPI00345AE7F3
MFPRPSQRSIFHLGEEGVDDHRGADEQVKNTDTTRILAGHRDHGRQLRKQDSAVDAVVGVGLQILVQNLHHTRAPLHSHIVLKQVVVLPTTVARHRRGPGSSFLSACSRCRRELSSSKDVYMYRGDLGFCSEECRCQQILADEATKREAMIKKKRMRRGLPHHLHHGPRSAMGAIGGASRRLVAIAY